MKKTLLSIILLLISQAIHSINPKDLSGAQTPPTRANIIQARLLYLLALREEQRKVEQEIAAAVAETLGKGDAVAIIEEEAEHSPL